MVFPEAAFEELFASPVRNGIYKKKEFHGSGVPILNMGELFAADRIRCAPDSLIDVTRKELDRFGVETGDLLFGRRSLVFEGSGKCSIVDFAADEPCVFESSLIRVRVDTEKADPDFLLAFFLSPQGKDRVLSIATQTAVSGIRGSDLALLPVPAPPLAVQKELGRAFRTVDVLIENNRRRVEILEQMARLIYRDWFVHFQFPGHEDVELVDSDHGSIPDGWEVMPVSSAIRINPRESVRKDDVHPFVAMADLSEHGMVCSPSELREGNSGAKFRNGDTLFARITPSLENGKTGFVNRLADGQVGRGSTEFLVFRGEAVGPEFTYLLARTEELRQHAIKSMSGASGRQRVRTESFDSYLLAVPPLDVQAQFAALMRPMFDLVKVLSRQNEVLREARDLLLPRLVSGELDVSELHLELAEVG
jgi:type I restriction enzyme, S subunit